MNENAVLRPDGSHRFSWGPRERAITAIVGFTAFIAAVLVCGSRIPMDSIRVDLGNINQAPSLQHPFGTDWVGRDMLTRTVKGLSISIRIGLLCTVTSSLIAVVLGIIGPTFGGRVDAVISWLVDLVLSVPHTIVIILVSIACGGGLRGIVIGVTVTHWTSLTRVIRAEVMQLNECEYIKVAQQFGKSKWYISAKHMLPHIIPQLVVGTVLIFPHAILHEASITFLGFGLPPHEPAIGVILAESMKYLTSGQWWLAFFPGLSLVLISMAVARAGADLQKLLDPATANR